MVVVEYAGMDDRGEIHEAWVVNKHGVVMSAKGGPDILDGWFTIGFANAETSREVRRIARGQR